MMFAKRIFLVFILTAVATTVGVAQSRRGWGNKTVTGATVNASTSSREEAAPNKLEGTWRAIETFPDTSAFKVLFTFSAGRDEKNGTTIHSDELFLTGGPSCLPTQGVWKRTGDRTFTVTDEGFCFDPSSSPIFLPVGKLTFKSSITLNERGTAFDGIMHVEAFDPNGVSVFMTDGTLHGDRMAAEAP
jgi:hypothetical protein